jgi:hypothetical protein
MSQYNINKAMSKKRKMIKTKTNSTKGEKTIKHYAKKSEKGQEKKFDRRQ